MPIASVAYGARLELAEKAQQTLDVQYYVLAQDGTGKRFIRALRDAARRGVRVRLLVDDVYTAGEDGMLAELAAEPHAEVRVYNLFPAARDSSAGRWLASWWDFRRVDHRMHNKLFVVDNALAVFGGRNIADPYFMRGADSNFVDLDVLAAGPVVRELSRAFDEYWNSDFVYPIETFAHRDPRHRQRDRRRRGPQPRARCPADRVAPALLGHRPATGRRPRWARGSRRDGHFRPAGQGGGIQEPFPRRDGPRRHRRGVG